MKNPEADVEKITSGQDTGDMLYQTITGLKDALPKVDEQQVKVDVEVSRCWLWVLWYLWKNMNRLLFEGKAFAAEDIIKKAKEESNSWFLAQQIQNQMEHT